MHAPNLSQPLEIAGMALRDLDQRGIREHRAHRSVLAGGRTLAPGGHGASDGARTRVELPHPWQPLPNALRVALLGGRLKPAALLPRPFEPVRFGQTALDLVDQLEQVGDVLCRVVQLLRRQRPGVPARVGGRLADAPPQHRPEQISIPGLSACAGEPGGHLRVEHISDLGRPGAAQDRHVLAAGVEDHLDIRVREQRGHGPQVEITPERVDQGDVRSTTLAVVHHHLGQAQQRPVAPLGHELRVDSKPPGRRGPLGGRCDLVVGRERRNGGLLHRRSVSAADARGKPTCLVGFPQMIFSSKAEYGVRLMVELGRQLPEHPTSLKAIADAEGLPLAYLEQVVARLRKAGLVMSARGAHGGYWLARPAEEIAMDEVVQALEGAIAPMECFVHDHTERVLCSHEPDAGRGCATKLLWMRVQGGIIRSLQTTMLADLVDFSRRHERERGIGADAEREQATGGTERQPASVA
jgi:Rrf2 family protein